ncbi:MAG: DNA alkylation repair protein [Endomicrobium sp.]|jgi:3-methyladenine DNA glycosylase AlkD|nr:DNA alkylation repair protein [Endomicrobium sp.]
MHKIILKELKNYTDEVYAERNKRILNICEGRYAQDDVLLGVRVPKQRELAKKYSGCINLKETEKLLHDKIHEIRFIALAVLCDKYKKSGNNGKSEIAEIYLRNYEYINNWDLVDSSAPDIAGHNWYSNGLTEFWEFAGSGNVWKERIAVVSTFYFIKRGRFKETLKLAEMFFNTNHDLICKASGWMLREIGKRDKKVLLSFLDKYASMMPKIMIRYSVEKFSKRIRNLYLKKN